MQIPVHIIQMIHPAQVWNWQHEAQWRHAFMKCSEDGSDQNVGMCTHVALQFWLGLQMEPKAVLPGVRREGRGERLF